MRGLAALFLLAALCGVVWALPPLPPVTITLDAHDGEAALPVVTDGVVDAAFDPALLGEEGSAAFAPASTALALTWHSSAPGISFVAFHSAASFDASEVLPASAVGVQFTAASGPVPIADSLFANSTVNCTSVSQTVIHFVVSFFDSANNTAYAALAFAWSWRCAVPGCVDGCDDHGTCDFPEGVCVCDEGWNGAGCEFVLFAEDELCPGDPLHISWAIPFTPRSLSEYYYVYYYNPADYETPISVEWGYFDQNSTSGVIERWLSLQPGYHEIYFYPDNDGDYLGYFPFTVKTYAECGFAINGTCATDSNCGGDGARGSCVGGECSCNEPWWWADCSHGCGQGTTLSAVNGTFTSDVSGGDGVYTYRNYATCTWTLDPEGDWDEIRVVFSSCEIGISDTVSFYSILPDGSKGELVTAVTESCTPGTSVTLLDRVIAEFVSDYSGQGKGFMATYSTRKIPQAPVLTIVLATVLPVLAVFGSVLAGVLLAWRRAKNKIQDIEDVLHGKLVASIMGTPAEHAVSVLLSISKKKWLSRKDSRKLHDVVNLISSNRLFKIDLKKKLEHRGEIDSDVNSFLFNTLLEEQTPSTSRSMRVQSMIPHALKTQESNALLEQLDSWSFDIQHLQGLGGPLQNMATLLFDTHGLFETFNISRMTAESFFVALEAGYIDTPYHNSLHAADVAQGVHCLLLAVASDVHFSDLEILAVLCAALCHDFKHPGLNSSFLQSILDPLAIQYSFRSILESMHSAESMRLLLKSPERNFLAEMQRSELIEFLRLMSSLILATDMAMHTTIIGQVSVKQASGSLDFRSSSDRLLLLQLFIKIADVSNATRPWATCEFWAHRVREEFCLQGDKEHSVGLPVSSFMSRDVPDLEKSQVAFGEFIVAPLVAILGKVCPTAAAILEPNLTANLEKWRAKAKTAATSAQLSSRAPLEVATGK